MKNFIPLIFCLCFLVGCTDYEELNVDPSDPVTSTPNFLLPPVMAWTATSIFDQGEEIAYLTQQLATFIGTDKYHDRWDYVTANRIALWRRHYHDISVNAVHVMQSARRENATNYEGVAKILYAFSTVRTTAIFGDMPYFEALKGNPSPPYDPQLDIYEQVILELDEAIDILSSVDLEAVRPLTGSEDHIFKGDLSAWISFAQAIKARTLLHLTPNLNQNYAEVIAAADQALSNWSDATFDYSAGAPGNPYQINQWGPTQARPRWDFAFNTLNVTAPGRFMLEQALKYDPITNTVGDPRTPYLMQPNADSIYLSIIPSTGKGDLEDDELPDLYGTYITQDAAPMLLFRQEELHFIKAEALFNQGDANGAFTAFTAGVITNMDRVGVQVAERNAFMSSSMLPQNGNELTLSHIMMQKYVAMWLDGEVWTDMRRYGYDNQIYSRIQPPPNLVFYWNEGEWIQRLPYDTETEEIYNKPELDRLGAYQNPEWLKVPMIWAPQ